MANENGTAVSAREKQQSVKRDDYASNSIQFVVPAYSFNALGQSAYSSLPEKLPPTDRDWETAVPFSLAMI